jgi:precorrin-3B methylase
MIGESEIIVGYYTYLSLEDMIDGKEVYRYAMTQDTYLASSYLFVF